MRQLLRRLTGSPVQSTPDPALPPGGDPAVYAKIEKILREVRDPESGLPIAELNLVRRVRVVDEHRLIYLDVPFDDHTPGCLTCAGIAMVIVRGIRRELRTAFERAFPGYSVEFI
ncbi:MAG: iron-sulfur cluster assembly protein [Alkalispirochaeta sp.]